MIPFLFLEMIIKGAIINANKLGSRELLSQVIVIPACGRKLSYAKIPFTLGIFYFNRVSLTTNDTFYNTIDLLGGAFLNL